MPLINSFKISVQTFKVYKNILYKNKTKQRKCGNRIEKKKFSFFTIKINK